MNIAPGYQFFDLFPTGKAFFTQQSILLPTQGQQRPPYCHILHRSQALSLHRFRYPLQKSHAVFHPFHLLIFRMLLSSLLQFRAFCSSLLDRQIAASVRESYLADKTISHGTFSVHDEHTGIESPDGHLLPVNRNQIVVFLAAHVTG